MTEEDEIIITNLARQYRESDAELLAPILDSGDAHQDWIAANNIYRWHRAIGEWMRDYSDILTALEIGVRFGYSAYALAVGFRGPLNYVGVDDESYISDSLAIAEANLSPLLTSYEFIRGNSLEMLGFSDRTFDLIHIDGGHSRVSAVYDMVLCWPYLKSGGLMLIDDATHIPDVTVAIAMFTKLICRNCVQLPTLRGVAAFTK